MHNAAVWLDKARTAGFEVDVTWRAFVLDEAGRSDGAALWDRPEDERGRSFLSLLVGKAAARQGREQFERFHMALLAARHDGGRVRLDRRGPLVEIAEAQGLDGDRLARDLEDPDLVAEVAADHKEAVSEHGVFGTPTFLFENGQSVFLKTFIPPDDEAAEAMAHFAGLFAERSYVGEVKRPQPPWPKGAI